MEVAMDNSTPEAMKELQAERDTLRRQVEQLQEEANRYRSLYEQIKQDLTLTEQDVAEWRENGVSGEQALAEIEEVMRSTRQEEELSRLREVERERDTYLQSLHFLTRPNVTFTEEELADMENNGVTGKQVLAEMDQILGVQ